MSFLQNYYFSWGEKKKKRKGDSGRRPQRLQSGGNPIWGIWGITTRGRFPQANSIPSPRPALFPLKNKNNHFIQWLKQLFKN